MAKNTSKKNALHEKNIDRNKTVSMKKKMHDKNQKIYGEIKSSNDEVTKLVELIFVILVIFAAFYLITTWVTKKEKNTPKQDLGTIQDSVIQYDDILLGNLLKQNKEEYYVLLIDKKTEKSKFSSNLSTYQEKEGSLKIYISYLDEAFNQPYKKEESHLITDDIESLK